MRRSERYIKAFEYEEEIDADEINEDLAEPFTRWQEVYAFQKGIEHGQHAESARLAKLQAQVASLLDAIEAHDDVGIGRAVERIDQELEKMEG